MGEVLQIFFFSGLSPFLFENNIDDLRIYIYQSTLTGVILVRNRRRTDKVQTVWMITLGILLSPAVASGVIKGLSGFEAAANMLSEIKVGDSGTPEIEKYSTEMLSYGFGWNEETENVISLSMDKGPVPYPEITQVRSGNVIRETYGRYSGDQYFDLEGGGQVRNCTDEPVNVLLAQSRLKPEFEIMLNSQPQVLIMHTHTTESFEPFERNYYDASFSYRSSDETMNIVSVGAIMKNQIEKYGISVIHDTTIHDYPSYEGSYERSAETVKKILSENPSIKVVLDIHRDAMEASGDLIAPVINVDGKNSAQVMIISGCDDGTMGMPEYLKNFRLATLFQQQFEHDTPGITRPILFDYRNYNQELTTGSLLIEVGSHGNSIDEVCYAGELIGNSIGKVLQGLA